jgi:hypothetical protein
MNIQIKNRFSGAVIFEHNCENNTIAITLKKAVAVYANLRSADLSGADLSGANLSRADLSSADLSDADLSRANLRDADLRGADLSDANLRDANLSGANLSGANLRGADLSGANLSRADLSSADLSVIKADFFDVLLRAPNEIAALRNHLLSGKVDGSVYEGECACLCGTIANARHVKYNELGNGLIPNSSRPIEVWFFGITNGCTPDNNQQCKITVEWIDEFLELAKGFAK